ncbi:MAG: HD domain-containing protein [Verrucomicrobia bacterium]|nr:HD domain-containing protein [Verrucomicrobiota bacterium]
MKPSDVVSDVFKLFNEKGHRAYGEDVTELQHALQCATIARSRGEPPAIVAACLLHDYGHLVHDLGEDIADRGIDARHEAIGANRLDRLFTAEVVEPVRLHVAAKRYLCWKDPAYLSGLSDASSQSLMLQGGPMSDAEAREFERHPHYQAAVRVRHYDDLGKDPTLKTPDIEDFRQELEAFVQVA